MKDFIEIEQQAKGITEKQAERKPEEEKHFQIDQTQLEDFLLTLLQPAVSV